MHYCWAQIFQFHGCIGLSALRLWLIPFLETGPNTGLNIDLSLNNESSDLPLFCPFFNKLHVDQYSGLTGSMRYCVAKNFSTATTLDIFKQVADDISNVSEDRLQASNIDHIYLFDWSEVQTSDKDVC